MSWNKEEKKMKTLRESLFDTDLTSKDPILKNQPRNSNELRDIILEFIEMVKPTKVNWLI